MMSVEAVLPLFMQVVDNWLDLLLVLLPYVGEIIMKCTMSVALV